MPRLRKKAARKHRTIEVSDQEFAYLNDDLDYESFDGNPFAMLDLLNPSVRRAQQDHPFETKWGAVRDEILETWIVERPGTRPRAWWRLEAPRWSDDPWDDCWYHGTFAEPRRRLGGKGTPIYEALNYVPAFEYGIPDKFVTAWDLAYYAEHGKNDGLVNHDHPSEPVEAFDPEDPPTFESQARYLWDRGLLEPEEKKAVEELGLLDQGEVVDRPDDEDELEAAS